MVSQWPVFEEKYHFESDENAVELIKAAVKGIRNVRAEMNVPPSRKAKVIVVSDSADIRDVFETSKLFFATLGYANEITVQPDKSGIADDAVSTVIHGATIYIPFDELVDRDKEIERLTKEKQKLEGEIKRATGMLSNEKFISKAPAEKVEEEKAKLQKYTDMKAQVEERLANLSK